MTYLNYYYPIRDVYYAAEYVRISREDGDKLESDKEKLNVTKNYFDKMDADYKKEVEVMKQQLKQNKEKVIDFLIGNVLNVELELPKSVQKKN